MATVTIQKRQKIKGISYVITFKDPITGKKKYHKSVHKHRIAQQEAHELRALLDSGGNPISRKKSLSALTFYEVSEFLNKEWEDSLSKNNLSEKTVYDYKIWLNVLVRNYGKRLLCDIKKEEIESFRDGMLEKNSAVSANKYLSIFKKVFRKGFELGAITNNITDSIKKLNEKNHERNRYLLPHGIEKLVQSAQQIRAKFYLPSIIYLGAEHGASKQEILDLRWSDIDFDYDGKGLIRFYRTKNDKERTDCIMPRSKDALLKWQDHQKWMRHRKKITQVQTDLVFGHLDGSPRKSFNKAWWQTLEIAGIEDFHFHDLRHTFGSNLILAGVG